jgi:hypothetical protein
MSERGVALFLTVLIGAGAILLTVLVAVLPRVRPDVVHLTLEYGGRPLKSFQVKLVEDPSGNTPCLAEGLPGITDAVARHEWQRPLTQQLDQGFRGMKDAIAVCAQISGEQRLIWQRQHLGWKERTDLVCDLASPARPCKADSSVTLRQASELAVVALLFAFLARALWNWRREAAASLAALFLLGGLMISCLLFALPLSPGWARAVSTGLVAALFCGHVVLSQVLREVEEPRGHQSP